ncbi:hypothetical protein NC653_006588 [Populus alba x Populus x berolinensis]|uniref:Uncharacterized protein n=1 Tax=Populus alba x Populus x berolinensis TaxID=444605 RepID=A0AAD6WCD1_9ROSI|nr:hypothetical protein NC653_006588 [Populus alba x Populus x berolinensis]
MVNEQNPKLSGKSYQLNVIFCSTSKFTVYRAFTQSLYMFGSSNSAGLQWSSTVALVRYGPASLLYCLPGAYLLFGQFFETETESPSFVSFLLIKEFSSWERHPNHANYGILLED